MKTGAAHTVESNEGLLRLEGLVLDARFKIERRLTCGSYAEIHLAHNLSPQPDEPEILIVKALNLWLQGEPDADLERTLIENIALEARTMRSFNHQNIVRLFSYGSALDRAGRSFYYLVLEFMRGGSLAQLCRAHPLMLEQTLDYTAQICAALSYAHALNVIHRDVKPSNIMLSAEGRTLKLLDFGVARFLNNDNGLITKVGTDLYAAPEHYSLSHAAAKLTPAADVYALAKCVYFMLCGQPPSNFRQQQIKRFPNSVEVQWWAAGVLRVLSKATSEQASERYQSAQDFYQALQAIAEQTIHSIRNPAHSATAHKRPNLRLVVDIIAEQPRIPGAMLKACGRSLTRYAGGLLIFIKHRSRLIYNKARPTLYNRRLNLSNLWQTVTQRLRMLPLKLLLGIAAVILICLTLLVATPHVIKRWRGLESPSEARQIDDKTTLGKIAIATTDINIRSSPSRKAAKIGEVSRNSKVRILMMSPDRRWCEIEVLQHGRNKEDVWSAERGWIYAKLLR